MAMICYVKKRFGGNALATIRKANEILLEYAAQGYDLTLRQLYYQFVSRDLIANTQREYKNLGSVINDARLAGLIDWDHIVDRTRNVKANAHWGSPQEVVEACAEQFQYDKWEDQPNRVEVWIEKDALVGVIERICRKLDVSFFSCRGYTSQSEVHEAAIDRIRPREKKGQNTIILHLGDHDPSGIDMTRDIQDRLNIFGCSAVIQRLALNMNQVERYQPPPNPAKLTDSRATDYVAKYGDESWELDALEPKVIEQLIAKNVADVVDEDLMEEAKDRERDARAKLKAVAENWEDLTERL